MPKRFKHILYSLLFSTGVCFLFFIPSCSEDPVIHCPTPSAPVRKVLIETFSGHHDGHGAIVSDTFQHIQQRYPGNVIGITIHSGYFAKVSAPPFEGDFHCDEGDEYYDHYNSATRILSASVKCNFLGSLTGTYKLVVLLTENDIIAAQKDYAQPLPQIDYQHHHHHVLRDGITSTWGDLLNTVGLITKGDSVIKEYSYTLPATFNGMVPNENNCHVVA